LANQLSSPHKSIFLECYVNGAFDFFFFVIFVDFVCDSFGAVVELVETKRTLALSVVPAKAVDSVAASRAALRPNCLSCKFLLSYFA